jgi:hypothetical protein
VQHDATPWIWTYNNERPNIGIGGLTPAQKLNHAAPILLQSHLKNAGITLRHLLIIGASTVVMHAAHKGVPKGSRLTRMMATDEGYKALAVMQSSFTVIAVVGVERTKDDMA